MKLKLCIVLLAMSISSYAQFNQRDSIGRIRKPVLQFLIGEHYRAVSLEKDLNVCKQQKVELKYQLDNTYKIIDNYKADSVLTDSLLHMEKAVGRTWKESYENEKVRHGETKNKVRQWKLFTFGSFAITTVVIIAAIKN